MKGISEMTFCMLFLRESGSVHKKAPLGLHPFGRIPVADEYVVLDNPTESLYKVYKVKHVIHTGFGTNHAAEIYVIEADDLTEYLKEYLPPA